MIRIQGIDHVAINCSDLAKSFEFYTKILGLKVTEREYSKPGIEYFLDCGSSLIGLIQGKESEGTHLFQNEGIGANHVSFRAKLEDFDAIVESLQKHHVTIQFSKKREKSWSVYFLDPDGNKLEITAWPLEARA
jgi:catechol 2,3-dioxygenase-like lactoylglutathione lyase family enzyme